MDGTSMGGIYAATSTCTWSSQGRSDICRRYCTVQCMLAASACHLRMKPTIIHSGWQITVWRSHSIELVPLSDHSLDQEQAEAQVTLDDKVRVPSYSAMGGRVQGETNNNTGAYLLFHGDLRSPWNNRYAVSRGEHITCCRMMAPTDARKPEQKFRCEKTSAWCVNLCTCETNRRRGPKQMGLHETGSHGLQQQPPPNHSVCNRRKNSATVSTITAFEAWLQNLRKPTRKYKTNCIHSRRAHLGPFHTKRNKIN